MDARLATSATWHLAVVVNDSRRALWGAERDAVLHKRSGESVDHVVLKLLSLVLFFDPGLVVEDPRRIGRYKADVSRRDDRGDVVQWVECGLVSSDKLDHLTRALGPVVVEVLKRGRTSAAELRRQLDETAAFPERVHVNAVDAGFVDALADALFAVKRARLVFQVDGESDDVGVVAAVDDVFVADGHIRRIGRGLAQV